MQVRLNITQKFIGFLLLTGVIPLLTVGISSYQASRRILQEEAKRYTAELVHEQKDYFELQLQQIESLIANISGVDEITEVLNQQPATADVYTSLATHARIGYILNGYTNLHGLISIDIFTMTGVHYHVGDTLNVSEIRSDVKNRILTQALQGDQRLVWVGIEDNVNANSTAQKVLTVAKLLYKNDPQTLESRPIAMLIVNYSVDYLYQQFKHVDLGEGAYLLVVDAQGRMIYHPNKQLLGSRINPALMQLLQSNQGSFVKSIDNQQMLVNYNRSELSNWVVLSFVPVETLVAPTAAIGMTTSLVLLVSFGVILGAAWLVSVQVVRPIRQITQCFELLQKGLLEGQRHLEVRGHDEVAELTTWFNTFLDSLTARHRAEAALRESVDRERATLRVVERMRQTLDLEQIFNVTTSELQHLLKCDRVVICRLHGTAGGAFIAESRTDACLPWVPAFANSEQSDDGDRGDRGLSHGLIQLWEQLERHSPSPDSQTTQGTAHELNRQYCCIEDVHQTDLTVEHLTLLEKAQVKATLIVPILRGNTYWGLLASYQHTTAHHWEDAEINLLIHISTQLGIALQQAELFTQIQQQSADLTKARDTAEQANRAKSNFLANMSHELRTPLNAILGFTQLLVNDPHTDASQRDTLTIINRNGEHLLMLINDVLDMSKIEVGKATLEVRVVDLPNLLDTLRQTFQLPLDNKQVAFVLEKDANLPQYIYADEGKLQQILTNLLSNAIKFTEVGKVVLRARTEAGRHTTEAPLPPPSSVILHLEVEDTGSGIAPEELALLFEPFAQTEAGRKSQQGSGLGLSISYRLLQLMGGEIRVESRVGVGTLFHLALPVSLPNVLPVALPNQSRRIMGLAPDQPPCRVLIVDDAKTNRHILVRLLSKIGFDLREAENGCDAVQVWEEWAPNLIFMDMKMPVMDGYEATQQIRGREAQTLAAAGFLTAPAPRRTTIIALTAHAFDEEREKVLLAGCDDFLSKPFRQDVLLRKIGECLGIHYLYEEPQESSAKPTNGATPASLTKINQADRANLSLQPQDLAVMPGAWIRQLHQAAIQARDRVLLDLIQQIPETQAPLAQELTTLVENFQFETIIGLTQQRLS